LNKNIKLTLAYDGTNFLGWQHTAAGPSIEGTLRSVLERILQEKVVLQAASRTDAGVHAVGQVVNFFTTREEITTDRLYKSINALLPHEIACLTVDAMPYDFHPTLHTKSKEYHYHLCCSSVQLPQNRLYSWHCPYALNLEEMRKAARLIIGTHNFRGFCNQRKELKQDFVRTIFKATIEPLENDRFRIEIAGTNFLYRMVRNIVGTLVYIGRGKMSPEDISAILAGQDRKLAGITAPPQGLALFGITY